jgi:hypothetical protein
LKPHWVSRIWREPNSQTHQWKPNIWRENKIIHDSEVTISIKKTLIKQIVKQLKIR